MSTDGLLAVAVLGFIVLTWLGLLGSFGRIRSADERGLSLVSALGFRRNLQWSNVEEPIEKYNFFALSILLIRPMRGRMTAYPFLWAIPVSNRPRGREVQATLAKFCHIAAIRNLGDLFKTRRSPRSKAAE